MSKASSAPFRVEIKLPAACGAVSFVPQTIGAAPNGWGASGCKHLSLGKVEGRWYKVCGDHTKVDPVSPDDNDGRQEIFSFTTAANDWRQDQPYWLPAGQLQFWNPDDAFCCVRNGEIWGWRSTGVRSWPPTDVPSNAATQLLATCAWTPPNGPWREVAPLPKGITQNRAWHAIHYAARDVFVIPSAAGYNASLTIQRGSDGADLSPVNADGFIDSPLDSSVFGTDCDWRVAGGFIRGDELYVFDHVHKQIIAVALPLWLDWTDGQPIPRNVARKVCDVPVAFDLQTQSAMTLIGHLASDRMMLFVGDQIYVAPLSNPSAWTQIPRQDRFENDNGNFVYASKQFYDADEGMVLSIATIDWETGTANDKYWLIECE